MNLREQEYVVELANTKNITKAAKKLCMSQPALSIFLSNLENSLGTLLFQRIGKTLVPTYAGELYIQKARQMLRLKQEFDYQLDDILYNLSGRIRLGLFTRQTPYLLPLVLKDFSRQYPQVEVSLQEHALPRLKELLRSGDIDLYLCNYDQPIPDFTAIPLYQNELLLALAWNHPLAEAGKDYGGAYPWLDISLLQKERFFLQHPHQNIRGFVDKAFLYHDFTPKDIFLVESIDAGVQMAAQGLGAAFIFKNYARYFTYSAPVRFYKTGEPLETIPLSAVHLKGMPLTAYMHDFLALVKKYL